MHDVPLLCKYTSATTAMMVLATRSLRWSSPIVFNDPFDVPRHWNGFTFAELEEAAVQRFRAYLRGEARPTSPAALKLLNTVGLRTDSVQDDVFFDQMRFFLRLRKRAMEQFISDMGDAWREKIPGIRVICFSEDPSSPVMWAHYGAAHTGVVLQFESNDERDTPWLLAQPVRYQAAKPQLPDALEWARAFLGEIELDWDRFLAEYHYVKHIDWSYEREYRVVSARKAGETGLTADYVFHPADLRGVILGVNLDSTYEGSIRHLVEQYYPATIVSRARIDYVHHRVVHAAT